MRRFDVDWLFDPIGPDDFLANYLERRVLHVDARSESRYDALFPDDQVERTIFAHGPSAADRLSAIFGDVPQRPPAAPEIDLPAWVRGQYGHGATLLLSDVGRDVPALAELTRALEGFARGRVNVNAYLSPQGSRGFTPHFDPHDILVLPIRGEKRWTLYNNWVELPTAAQRCQVDAAKIGPPTRELTLRPGDLLYLPRGLVHEAVAQTESTVHLTIGLFFPTWGEVLSECLATTADRVVALRKSLAASPQPDREIATLVAALGEDRVAAAFDSLQARFVGGLPPLPRPLSVRQRELTIHDWVERVPGEIAHVIVTEAGVHIAFPGISESDYQCELAEPVFMASAVRFVSQSEAAFCVGELPGEIDDERRVRFAARLLRAGFLQHRR